MDNYLEEAIGKLCEASDFEKIGLEFEASAEFASDPNEQLRRIKDSNRYCLKTVASIKEAIALLEKGYDLKNRELW